MSNEENLDKQNEQIPAEEEQQTAAQETSPAEPAEPRTEQQPEAEEHPQAEEQPQTEEQPQAEEEEVLTPAGKVKREKPARTRPPKAEKAPLTKEQKSKNIKLFKLVYYPVLAVFVLLMLAFSIVDGVYGYSRAPQNDAYFDAVNAHIVKLSDVTRSSMAPSDKSGASGLELAAGYITDTLEKGGFYVQEEKKTDPEDEDEAVVTVTDWHKTASGVKDPTVTYHTAVSSAELQNKMGTPHFLAGLELTNIVVGIPSEAENAPAVVVTVRYDSRTDTVGAAENAAFVANVMQTLIDTVKSGAKFQNDIIVVFTEDLDYSYGAYAFFDSFNGFDNVASRAKYGVNLDAYGNGGTLAVTDVSGAGFDYINAVAGVSGTAFNSSIVCDTLPEALKVNGAVKAFGDVPAVQVASVGSLDNAQSAFDTAGELSQAIVAQQASFIKQYIEEFGNSGDTFDAENDGKIAMFSYFEGTVAYTSVASYVIGALLLLLIGGAVAAMIFYKDPKEKELDRGGEKAFSVKRSFLGMAAQLMVIAGTLVTMFAAYFLITLMLTGFGVLPIHAITTVRYFNAGILIAAMILSSAAAFGFTNLFRKLFNVKEPDMLRGSAFLFGFAGAVMCFACPAYSFLTSWLGILMTGILLLSVFVSAKFRQKFGIGFNQLYPYVWAVAFCLPIVMSNVAALTWLLPTVLLPVTMTLFTGMLGSVAPYFDRTRKVFDKLAKKLPDRTIRVERTVVERVEDKAKKGKFTEKTVKRVEKEKVPVNYKNYFGISVLSVIGVVVALLSGGFGFDYGKTLTGYLDYDNAVYNDALVYEWERDSSGDVTQRVVVDDLAAYKYMRYALDFEWDAASGRYVKEVTNNKIIDRSPAIVRDADDIYTVTTYEGARSAVTLTIPSAKSITKITLKERSKEGNTDYEGYVYEFENKDEIVLRLPNGFGDFTVEFETSGSLPTKFEYEERLSFTRADAGNLDILDEWVRLLAEYSGSEVGNYIRGGIVIKSSLSI